MHDTAAVLADDAPLRPELPVPPWTWWPPARVYGTPADAAIIGAFCMRVLHCSCGSAHLCNLGIGHRGTCRS